VTDQIGDGQFVIAGLLLAHAGADFDVNQKSGTLGLRGCRFQSGRPSIQQIATQQQSQTVPPYLVLSLCTCENF